MAEPAHPALPAYDAIVLAGGTGRRLGGADKPALLVGGISLLERALAAVTDAGRTVVVGPERATDRPVDWAREDPPGGGPAAALAAGLARVQAGMLVLLAADLPLISAGLVRTLRAAAEGAGGALLVDADGRDQPLTSAWSTAALRTVVTGLDLHGAPLRTVLGGLDPVRVPLEQARLSQWYDCDTQDDLRRAKGGVAMSALEDWTARAQAELGIVGDVDLGLLLDLARDVAHGVVRPAAPVTTYLLGVAVGRGADPVEAARRLTALLPPVDPDGQAGG